jgi:hypothetical protein
MLLLLALAQCQLERLLAADGGAGAEHGFSVAVDGDTALVGAFGADGAAPGAGAVYVLQRSGAVWVATDKLTASDGAGGSAFGVSVDLDGERAIVGASLHPAAGPEAGAAYVFERSGGAWHEAAQLLASDAEAFDRFGESVAISGDRAVVGMHVADDAPPEPGAAYVFERAGGVWSETAKLTDPTAADDDHYGAAVDVRGDRILLGARLDSSAGPLFGAAHVLDQAGGTWTITQELHASDAETGDAFGWSVELGDGRLLVGAIEQSNGGPGAVYVFELAGGVWGETARLTASDGAPGDRLGASLALDGERVLAGADMHDGRGANAGAAYLFAHAGGAWSEAARLVALDAEPNDRFGASAALDGDALLVGAPFEGTLGVRAGATYSFSASGSAFPSLLGAPASLSIAAGGVQALALHGCQEHAGLLYVVLGSLAGTSPGLALGGVTLPLNPDFYLLYTANHPGAPPLAGGLGLLDAGAAAQAVFALPPASFPALVGLAAHHAFVLVAPSGALLFASVPAPLAFAP